MKKTSKTILLVLCLCVICVTNSISQEIPDGPYFGQEPPGMEPEIFAPGFISVAGIAELGITFSPDGKEFCYSSDFKIYYTKKEDGNWTDPVIAYFVGDSGGVDPKFSPCGNLFTFQRNDDLYFCENINQEWSDPEPFPYPINTDKREGSASISLDSILYFTANNRSGNTRGDIYRTTYFKDGSTAVEKINTLCTNDDEDGLYIAPDESYIIFWSWRGTGYGMHDLYISFNTDSDSWTIPKNMGPIINTSKLEVLCSISPDGKYLFFTRGNDMNDFDIYWVSTSIIDSLKNVTSIDEKTISIPREFKLFRNYPNPFNPETTIKYQLLKNSAVKLKISNILGREINTLVDSFQCAGEYSFVWNGKDNTNNSVSSGIYIYSLSTNELNLQKKMILIR